MPTRTPLDVSKSYQQYAALVAANKEKSTANAYDNYRKMIVPAAPREPIATDIPSRTPMAFLKDTSVDLRKGVVGLVESGVGLTNIATGNMVGEGLDALGYDAQAAQDRLSDMYSPARQVANKNVEDAEGFFGTVKALGENPSAAFGMLMESAPGTASIAGITRLVAGRMLAKEGIKQGTKEAAEFFKRPDVLAKLTAISTSTEGAQAAGSIQEDARHAGRDWSQTVIPAILGGASTAAIGFVSSKIIPDVETKLATASLGGGITGRGGKELIEIGKAIAKDMFKEGVMEELPQSASEQVFTNLALGRTWNEGVAEAAAAGMVVGAMQGGAMSVGSEILTRAGEKQNEGPQSRQLRQWVEKAAVLDQKIESGMATDQERHDFEILRNNIVSQVAVLSTKELDRADARDVMRKPMSANGNTPKDILLGDQPGGKGRKKMKPQDVLAGADDLDVKSEEDLTDETIRKIDEKIAGTNGTRGQITTKDDTEEPPEYEIKSGDYDPLIPPDKGRGGDKLAIEATATEKPAELAATAAKQMYRGSGRETKGEAYNDLGDGEALLGDGQFWALNENDAKRYGPTVESQPIPEYSKPLIVKDDYDWQTLVKKAVGKYDSADERISYPNPTGLPKEKMDLWRKGVSDYLRESGHDALIINMDGARGDDAKTLGNTFGHSQIFIPSGAAKDKPEKIVEPAATSQATTAQLPKSPASAGENVTSEDLVDAAGAKRKAAIDRYTLQLRKQNPNITDEYINERIRQIDEKDNIALRKIMNGINPGVNRLFTELTGLPAKTQKEADASLRSMNPEKWDNWQKEKKEAFEKQEAERAATKQKRELDSLLNEQVRSNGVIIKYREHYDKAIAAGHTSIEEEKKGVASVYRLTNPQTHEFYTVKKKIVADYLKGRIEELRAEQQPEAPKPDAETLLTEDDLHALTYDSIVAYEATKGVGSLKEFTYKRGKYKAINKKDGREHNYVVQIRNDGQMLVTDKNVTEDQINKDLLTDWGKLPEHIKTIINTEWPDLNQTQKNSLARVMSGNGKLSPTDMVVISGGKVVRRAIELFPDAEGQSLDYLANKLREFAQASLSPKQEEQKADEKAPAPEEKTTDLSTKSTGDLVKDMFAIINEHIGERGSISTKEVDETLYQKLKPYLLEIFNRAKAKSLDAKAYLLGAVDSMPEGKAKDIYEASAERFVTESIDITEKESKLESKEGDENAAISDASKTKGTLSDDRAGLEGQSAQDLSGAETSGKTEGVRGESGRTNDGELRQQPVRDGYGSTENGAGRPSEARSEHNDVQSEAVGGNAGNLPGVRRPRTGNDHVIEPGTIDRSGSWFNTAKTNLDIIELVKKLDAEGRMATPEEQSLLAKYTGFGASELANKLFPGYAQNREIYPKWERDEKWREQIERMVNLLTPEEIATAARSTQYAHYTSPAIINSIYKALNRFGFKGGKILEPGMGVGSFFGLMPSAMRDASFYTGIEFDAITAKIAKHLYQNQNILAADYTKQKLPNGFFDLGIGNPPFSSIKILTDPDYKKLRLSLHDYFFVKSLDKVRPGGLLVFITSRYTMDKQDDRVRQMLNDKADLLGAIRLPQTAFKQNAGTEVVTDVIFLRKKVTGETSNGMVWKGTSPVATENGEFPVNEYYVQHPEMVLGKHSGQGSMYKANEYTVLPLEGNIEQAFEKAAASLPENVYSIVKAAAADQKNAVIEQDFNPANKKEGGVYLTDKGEVMVTEQGRGVPIQTVYPKINPKEKEWLKDYIGLRDALKTAQYDQLNEGQWEKSLEKLRKTYKAFIKKHGRISEFTVTERKVTDEDGNEQIVEYRKGKNNKVLRYDVESPLVDALDSISEDGVISDAAILKDRTILKPTVPEITSVPDALAVSLNDVGSLNIDHIASLMGRPRQEIIDQLGDLIYERPDKEGNYILADEYLSGNVVDKLEVAKETAKIDPKFIRNVEALQNAQPDPLSAHQITVNPGVSWIPLAYYNDFIHDVLDLKGQEVHYQPAGNIWTIAGGSRQGQRGAASEWSTSARGANEIFDAVLNNSTIRVNTTVPDGNGGTKTVLDPAETAAANDIAKKMRARFKTWVWEDASRTNNILEIYNAKKNTIVPRKFDGKHLTLPGVSLRFALRPHQKNAIWRVIQDGNTYIYHAVGAGKTYEMVAAGMEQRRLGLIKKPLYVVPNHMLRQFSNEFQELYPMAHIMVADEENFHTTNRKRFMAQAALNNPDAIVITHSAFRLLKMKAENITPVRERIISELQESLKELEADKTINRIKIKQMEKRIEQVEQRFDSMIAGGDNVLTFEDMGVDFLFVDEAHQFRKLDFTTNRQAKGIDPTGSRRAMDLYIKTKWLSSVNEGRSHVFASGTPVTNTMGELYTVMKFFMEEEMDREGIHYFDSWANEHGEMATAPEMNAAGRYEMVERFAKFVNMPELMSRVRTFMDVLTNSQLGGFVNRPKIKGGNPTIVVTPKLESLKDFQDNVLLPRIEASKAWKPSPGQPGNPDPLFNIITDGRLASIDLRFVQRGVANDPNSKLNQYIDKIITLYQESKDNVYMDGEKESPIKGGAVIAFYNHGFGKDVAINRGFDARAWMMSQFKKAGIKATEVAWIDDYDTAAKKEAMFEEMRNGHKRILIGSAKKMGTGMNVQTRLANLVYLDPPWYPSDVEQPLGRIIRQGNQNKEVGVYYFATKGSYDATMWQMVQRKASFQEDAFSGAGTRSIEDISETSLYEMAAALASGDERAIRLAGLSADIDNLENLRVAHHNSQNNLKKEKNSIEYWIPKIRKNIANLKEADEKVEYIGRVIDAKSGNKTFTERKEFGEALLEKMLDRINADEEITVQIGSISGFPVLAKLARGPEKIGFDDGKVIHIPGAMQNGIVVKITDHISYNAAADIFSGTDPVGLATKIINKINGVSADLRKAENDLAEQEDELKKVNARLGAPFEFAQELNEKIAEANQIKRSLEEEANVVPDSNDAPVQIDNVDLGDLVRQRKNDVAALENFEDFNDVAQSMFRKKYNDLGNEQQLKVEDSLTLLHASISKAEAILSQHGKGNLDAAQEHLSIAKDRWNDWHVGEEYNYEIKLAQHIITSLRNRQERMFEGQLYSVAKNKNVITTLTGKEIAGPDYFQSAKNYFRNNLQGKMLYRKEIGDIRVTGKGWEKARRGIKTDELKARLFPAIPAIIENGQYHGREAVTGRKDDIVAFHYFDGTVNVGGESVQVGGTVAEDSRGNLFYNINHDADRLWSKRKAHHEPGLEALGGEPLTENNSSDSYNVTNDEAGVNIVILPDAQNGQDSTTAMPTLAEVQEAFKGQTVTQAGNGFKIDFKNGRFLTIAEVDNITPNSIILKATYGKESLGAGETIKGGYANNKKLGTSVIKLVQGKAGKWTLAHESVHFMEDIGVIDQNEVTLLKNHIRNLVKDGKFETANNENIGGEEDRANFLADALTKEPKGFIGRILGKVQDFIDKLVNAFGIRTVRGITRDIKTGKVFENESNNQRNAQAEAYAVGQRFIDADMPVDNVDAKLMDIKGSRADITIRAKDEFLSWSNNIKAADGSNIILHNPDKGSIGSRIYHLIRDNESQKMDIEKAKWLPNVPATLLNAAKRLYDHETGNRIYVRAYKGGKQHMVIVRPDGIVDGQKPFSGRLITQFPSKYGSKRDRFIIEWERENGKGDLQEGTSPATTTSTVLGPRKGGQVTNEDNLISTDDNLTPDNGNVNEKYSIRKQQDDGDMSLFPEVNKRLKAAKGVKYASLKDRVKDALVTGWEHFTRHFQYLDPKSDGAVIDVLRRFQDVPAWAKNETTQKLASFVGKLSPQDRNVFSMNIILPDMLRDIDGGLLDPEDGLPFGYADRDQVQQDYNHFQKQAESNPEIKHALRLRNKFMRDLTDQLVENKILKADGAKDPSAYFHHQVLAYANYKEKPNWGMSSQDVRTHRKGWQIGRKGVALDYNTEFVEAEFEVISQALTQIETVKTLNEIQRLADIKAQLVQEAKDQNKATFYRKANIGPLDEDPLQPFRTKIAIGIGRISKMASKGELYLPEYLDDVLEHLVDQEEQRKAAKADEMEFYPEQHPKMFQLLNYLINYGGEGAMPAAMIFKAIAGRNKLIMDTCGKDFVTYRDLVPEGYVIHKPDATSTFYFANTITDQAIGQVMDGNKALPDAVQQVLARGKDHEWVIKDGLSKTLNEFRPRDDHSIPAKISMDLLSTWKQWILMNPFRVIKYNINNMSGDLDIAMAYDPKIITGYLLDAFKDLWASYQGKDSNTLKEELSALMKDGVIGSGMTQIDIPELHDVKSVKELVDFFDGKTKNALSRWYAMNKKMSTVRENALRLAAYRYFIDRLNKGDKNVYGASRKSEIDAVKRDLGNAQTAAKLARELIGDYGNISHSGQYIRQRLIPFWSWCEINAPRYVRLFQNLKHEEGSGGYASMSGAMAWKATKLGAKAMALMGMVMLWNASFFPDEEDELQESGREQLHLILGRRADGSIITLRFQGALSDALAWFGMGNPAETVKRVAGGTMGAGDVAKDMVFAPFKKGFQGLRPEPKILYEVASGQAFFPDPLNPRPIRDTVEHISRTFSLDKIYKLAAGKPKPDGSWGSQLMRDVSSLVVAEADPGEQAYYTARKYVFGWLDKEGKERGMSIPTNRSNALYYYKQALRYSDFDAAARYLKKYQDMGGKLSNVGASVRRAHPLSSMSLADRYRFKNSLSPEQRKTLDVALDWYKRHYLENFSEAVKKTAALSPM